jgi:hypothetical protein
MESRPPARQRPGEAASFPGKKAAAMPFPPPKSLLPLVIGRGLYCLELGNLLGNLTGERVFV